MSLAQLSSDPHIAERGFLRPVESGGPRFLASAVVGEAGRPPIRRPAPRLARHSAELRDESPTHDSSRDSSKPPGQAANSQATMPCPNVPATSCLTGFSRQSAVCTPGPVASARTRSDRTSRTPNSCLLAVCAPCRPAVRGCWARGCWRGQRCERRQTATTRNPPRWIVLGLSDPAGCASAFIADWCSRHSADKRAPGDASCSARTTTSTYGGGLHSRDRGECARTRLTATAPPGFRRISFARGCLASAIRCRSGSPPGQYRRRCQPRCRPRASRRLRSVRRPRRQSCSCRHRRSSRLW